MIESKYKQLQKIIGSFPEGANKYNLIVNKALLQQELLKRNSPARNQGSETENNMLEYLGFSPDLNQKSSVMIKFLDDLLNSDNLSKQTANLIKDGILDAEFTARLKTAGVADNQMVNMKQLIRKVEGLSQKLRPIIMKLLKKLFPLIVSLNSLKQRLVY